MAKFFDSILDFVVRASKACLDCVVWALDRLTSALSPLLVMITEISRLIKEMLSHATPAVVTTAEVQ